MPRLKSILFGLMLPLAVASCASKPPAPCLKPLPPAAWAMQPPSNSLEKLDQLFSISEKASSTTGQN
ncbi:Rz1 family lipoprotein [Xenorhabdus ishibashii]|uniref:Rz1 family lipoprotein n=1 Tax=Xenorhabdus ishibashii TaxID=1034471 RepID=UPI00142DEB6D|nr:Rz1 family lipoprotein [Xenorhabdus ishibashii]